ncbi:hypothetical protein QOZ80_6AG0526750 [Eleusine coracana subsp. coracana]|nr:hypothetical protein QOZ80_6AG0526750 [Eleusine coracana subsp. coracana]
MAHQQPSQIMSRPDWSTDLPEPEHLQSIGKRLASSHDAASFRSVCSEWRAAVPFKSFAPLLLLPFGPESDKVTFYSVIEEEVFSVPLPDDVRGKVPCDASRGWLALMDEAASVTLFNPFTGGRVQLPPADEHVAEASLVCVSKVEGKWVLDPEEDARVVKLEEVRDMFFHEIVLSAPPYPGRDCVAIAVLPNSTMVAFCRVGVDSAWTLLYTNLECSVECVVHCQEKIYAVDITGDISICHCNNAAPTATLVPSLSAPGDVCHRSYMESDGKLHLVGIMMMMLDEQRFTYNTVVYRCDDLLLDQTPVWSMVDDVGDLTLLVSKDFNENFSGPNVSKYKRNSIYFSEALYRGQTNVLRYEIIDIATDASKVVCVHGKVEPSQVLPLCWFRPNLWMGVETAEGVLHLFVM